MERAFVCLFCLLEVYTVNCDESNFTSNPLHNISSQTNTSEPSTNLNDTLSDEYPVWDPPEVLLDSASGVDVPSDSKTKTGVDYKPLVVHFLQKFSPGTWIRPIYDKWNHIKDLLAYPDHPNYGGVQVFGPQHIWEKLHEKGHNFLTGIRGSVFGLAPLENFDYPFAYRRLPSTERSNRV